jgi:transglutaminase-like putative cysteine protease
MLMALAAFLSRLIEQPGDTRIILAELLIQLQVLHSFDLPRRKDLGYSMVIGLILLGVAATISQTLTFAPLLLLFLAVAIPVLRLDYQSRLNLRTVSWQPGQWPVRHQTIAGVAGDHPGVGGVDLLVFAPFTGISDSKFSGEFDHRYRSRIFWSEYYQPGLYTRYNAENSSSFGTDNTADNIQETSKLDGPGVVDSSSYYGFNRQMNQNLRGEMTPQVVMRVRSQSPGFWRVLAFDHYTGQGWEISRNEEVRTLSRSNFSYQTLLPIIPQLGREREVVQTYTLVNNLPNLIPALYQPRELYFPTREVAIDTEGGLRSPVGLEAGMTYTVISRVPYRDRTQLGQANTEYPAEIRQHYLQVPDDLREPVRERTEALLAESPTPLTDPYEKALYLAQALKQRYTIQPELPFFDAEQDLVEAFLFEFEGGYPDHFSTALTIMLRSIGIPARLVAGFGPGEFNPLTGFHIVRNVDAYAMTEVYFPQYGWYAFDPIPGHELLPPTIRDHQTFSMVRRFWNWIAGWLPSPVVGVIDGIVHLLTQAITRGFRIIVNLFNLGWVGIILGMACLTFLGFLGWLAFLLCRSGWRRWQLQRLEPTEQIYRQMLSWFDQQGIPKRPSETPLEYGQRLYAQAKAAQAQPANEIAHAYVRWRYGGEPQNMTYLGEKLRVIRQR